MNGKLSVLFSKAVFTIFISLIIFLLIGMILPTGHSASRKALKISCIHNLKQISSALLQYASDYKENYPPYEGAKAFDLLLKKKYLTDPSIFICPLSKNKPAKLKDDLTEENVSYIYEPIKTKIENNYFLLQQLCWDKPNNHKESINVGFSDAHVQEFNATDWAAKTKDFCDKENIDTIKRSHKKVGLPMASPQ